MVDIKMVDVTIHIDETLDESHRTKLADSMRGHNGVVGVGYHDAKPHLMVVEYDPDRTDSTALLQAVKNQGVHAELIGL